MIVFFKALRTFTKPSTYVIDNNIFFLHYRITSLILMACSLLVTGRQYFGQPIECLSRDDIPTNVLDTYCWVQSTFSIEKTWKKKVGVEVPYPGVEKSTPDAKRVYHAYYQWVCFALFFQALLFYVPRYIWLTFEAGRVESIVLGLNLPINKEEVKSTNRAQLVDYLYRNLNNNNGHFSVYAITEGLHFLNVILQMIFMDRFLGGEFTLYGWNVITFTEWDDDVRYDPMIKVFPRMTKCTFHRFGSSGDVQTHDAMCILNLNIINEKIYIFLWFWFYFLAISSIALLYRVLTILMPQIRYLSIQSLCLTNREALHYVCNRCQIGDWFILDLLSKNLDPINFKDLIQDFSQKLKENDVKKI